VKLVIVESPAKARTIEKFLGPDYRVEASFGHIRDLPSSAKEVPDAYKDKPWSNLAVDTENGFAPIYVVPRESQKRVRELQKVMRAADEILLATDEDREGESISWHLLEVLGPRVPVKRIAFHEITKSAILEALDNPRDVDEQLVRAQEARRILDRLFGYSLSPVLWKKVRTKLSAGRVQSVALRLIVEREEERQRFRTSTYWDVEATLAAEQPFTATLVSIAGRRLATGRDFDATTGELDPKADVVLLGEEEARAAATSSAATRPWSVSRVEKKETRQRPYPPFTTSTLQQAASARLGMSPKQTMAVAQRLYEGIDLGGGEREGLITYMRTDSMTLSRKALDETGAYIAKEHGDAYYDSPRLYRTKSKSAQEAHEAIRPTEILRTPDRMAGYLRQEELALYRLIWERTVACQMTDAVLDQTTVEMTVDLDGISHVYRATGSVLRFPGFLAVAGGRRDDTLIPALEEGQEIGGGARTPGVEILGTEAKGHETRPPARYTEATLVKKLEEEGIGRPSTYTPTISTIQDRDYVVKKGNYLVPTYVGMAVTHLLREHFPQYVDVRFTARLEDRLDDIAAGDLDWQEFLARFYFGTGTDRLGLERQIEEELPKIDYPAIPVRIDPETEKQIYVRIGRNTIYVQRGEGGEGDRATVPVDLLIDELTPDKARELLDHRAKAEEPLGHDESSGEPIYLKIGPYGPYVQLGEVGASRKEKPKRASLPRGVKAEEVSLALARRLLSLPRELGTDPATAKTVTAGLGRYGPFVERDGKYANLDGFEQIFTVTLDEAVQRLDAKKGGKRTLKTLGRHPESGQELEVLSGRYGPYVSDGEVNASLPRDLAPEDVTLERALELLTERAKKGKGKGKTKGRGRRRRTS
jgi:DNA topoisomerase-1